MWTRSSAPGSRSGSARKSKKPPVPRELSHDARSQAGSHITVNPPSSYMNKYVKNNPVRSLEKNLAKTRENVMRLKEELDALIQQRTPSAL